MPTKKEHLKIIENNFETLSHLSKPDASKYTDWCTTIIFYTALHYIHTALAKTQHPSSHQNLQEIINGNPRLKPLYGKYRNLQDDSAQARYMGHKPSIYGMRNSSLKWFEDIQNHVCSKFSLSDEIKKDLYPLFPNT